MERTLHPMNLLLMMATSIAIPGKAASLEADGRLRVEGASWKETRVFVVPAIGNPYELQLSDTRFTIMLPLQDEYLLSFEREGCPTKQIIVNANVPARMSGQQFTFPFLVTLSYLPEEDRFEYDGPVGFVRYDAAKADFTHSTQYNVKRGKHMIERLEHLRQGPLAAPGVNASTLAAAATSSGTAVSGPAPTEDPIDVPPAEVVNVVPAIPLVERATLERLELRTPPMVVRHLPRDPLGTGDGTFLGTSIAAEEHKVSTADLPKKVDASPVLRAVQHKPRPLVSPPCSCEAQETIIESRRVTYIARAMRDGVCRELRKVVHGYGGVFYFEDARSITARDHEQAISSLATLEVVPVAHR